MGVALINMHIFKELLMNVGLPFPGTNLGGGFRFGGSGELHVSQNFSIKIVLILLRKYSTPVLLL